jgi:hypothetical protein
MSAYRVFTGVPGISLGAECIGVVDVATEQRQTASEGRGMVWVYGLGNNGMMIPRIYNSTPNYYVI